MLREFRDFITRGSVIDLAIAVVIGAAFGAVITSFVNNILMPIIGALLGGVDFTTLAITVGDAVIAYGKFIQAFIDFLLIAFVVFLIVRSYNRMRKTEAAVPPGPTPEETLLTEIRDLLARK